MEAQIGRATTKFTPVEKVLPTVFVESGNNINQDTLGRFDEILSEYHGSKTPP
jgi:hypothetical protein